MNSTPSATSVSHTTPGTRPRAGSSLMRDGRRRASEAATRKTTSCIAEVLEAETARHVADAGLRYVSDAGRGFTRKRRGRSFARARRN